MRIAGREVTFDPDAPLSFGDVYALREVSAAIGVATDRLISDVNGGDADARGQAVLVMAFLAAARQDHDLRWREFVYAVPIDGVEILGSPQPVAPAVANQAAAVVAAGGEDELTERVLARLAAREAPTA